MGFAVADPRRIHLRLLFLTDWNGNFLLKAENRLEIPVKLGYLYIKTFVIIR